MELFNRKYKVGVETIETEDLDVVFTVIKTLNKEPNTCELQIFNLNPEHRGQLAQKIRPWVTIEAGYEEGISLIFSGQVRVAHSYRDGPDWITELSSGDGEHALKTARINKSYNKGTKMSTVIQDLAKNMGVGIGNAITKARTGQWAEAGDEVINSIVTSGSAATEMSGLMKSMNKEWSVQDGNLQILDTGQPLNNTAILLSPETGLIGSPTIGSDKIINIKSLMNGSIVPGSKIELESSELPVGFYRCQQCDYIGDTAGAEWYVEIEAKAL